MPTPLRRRLRIARRAVFYGATVVLVLVASLLAVASQLLPLAERHPDKVAAWLSQRAGRPVAFDRVETQWTRRGPLLRLDRLRIGEGAQAFNIGDAEMLVSLYAGVLPGQAFSELRLSGLDLTLERADDGRWKVRGLPGQEREEQGDPLSALEGLGELQVIGAKLAVVAPSLGVDARVPKIDLRLRVNGDRVRAGARAWPSVGVAGAPSTPLDVVLDFDRKRGDGRAYAGAVRADLSGWSPLLKVAGIRIESGQGRAEAWADLREHRIAGVMVSAALDRVGLRAERTAPADAPATAASTSVPAAIAAAAAPVAAAVNGPPGPSAASGTNRVGAEAPPTKPAATPVGGPSGPTPSGQVAASAAARAGADAPRSATDGASGTPPPPARVEFEHVEALAHYRLTDNGWRLDASRLRIGSGANVQTLDGLAVAGGERYALRADRIDAGPLIAVAALSDALPERLRRWFETAKPRVALSAIAVNGHRDGPMFASARVDALGFDPVGHSPGLQGLAGTFQADADGFAFDLDPNAPMRFDWPSGFGVPHTVKLVGSVGGWREGAGWRVGTTALRIDGGDFGLRARGGMWWQGDGSRPWIDIAADLDPTRLPVAKGFWVRSQMSQRLLNWLDTALVAGTLTDAHAVVSGDLDDWPFNRNNGLFYAGGKLRGATVKFQPDWPAMEGLDADIAFVGDGFSVEGGGKIAGVGVRKVRSGIERYHDGMLYVNAETDAEAGQLLSLLRQSPLHKEHADTLDNLRASGPAAVAFDMQLALREGGRTTLKGGVDLADAKLADPRWKVAFEQVRGHADFSRAGFAAENLAVLHDGAPGKLSLRAGEDYVRDKGNAFEAGLDAMSAADDLIARGPDDLAWLKEYLDGRSLWTVGIAIPRAPAVKAAGASVQAPTLLHLQSNLVGTSIGMPPPLNKAAATPLQATIETPLPLGSGDVRVALGNTLALRSRNSNGKTGVRVVLGANRVDDLPPPSGLLVTGRTDTLEAIDWIALAHGDGSDDSLPLQRIDVNVQRLQLLGGVFPNTRLVVAPAARGATAVRAEGAALDGAVMIPAGGGGGIAGKFARVHWTAADAGGGATAGTGAGNGAGNSAHAPASAAAAAKPADASMDPAKIPALTIDIADLRFGSAALGTASVRTRPTPAGMRIDQISTRGGKQSIDLSGDWTGRGAAARTHLSATVDSGDVGALMNGFGFGGQIGGGKGKARLDAGWPGAPAAMALGSLEGSLSLDVRDGRLIEIEPGAGRMLGLLSVAQLPRRLTLDFRDLFSKGFAFDRVGGTVRFGNGSARSDDLSIDGPAASIAIRGAADLRAQSYDQTIEVRPKAANVLTAVGALAAGPVGAAIGAAANAVLQKPLGSLTSRTYRVTGPWKEPKVEVLSREQTRAAARPAPPAG
ncbi:YhdP family protein [Lysobacter enzymogenes]|uniref:YhdP family protein n=1 Tax=Lysobacter enzymogenes TaxID=69 RepID=UPI001AF1E1CB|nr:YhdP family protein [Lysobacter enzymogenes]QQQ03021.1 TIGR02099 family protein [Lysobacter enzymogenes]